MIDAEEYQRVLAEHGRRVANRVAWASASQDERNGWDWCETIDSMFGSEDDLPEHERMRPGNPANDFDPTGLSQMYENHPYNENSIIYQRTKGASAHWLDTLVKARKFWGKWVVRFMYESLVLDISNEVYDAIADDQGEFVTVEDGATFCAWFEGWRGWAAWSASLSDDDIATLGEVFAWARKEEQPPHKWPNPGTQEAESLRFELPSSNHLTQEIKQ